MVIPNALSSRHVDVQNRVRPSKHSRPPRDTPGVKRHGDNALLWCVTCHFRSISPSVEFGWVLTWRPVTSGRQPTAVPHINDTVVMSGINMRVHEVAAHPQILALILYLIGLAFCLRVGRRSIPSWFRLGVVQLVGSLSRTRSGSTRKTESTPHGASLFTVKMPNFELSESCTLMMNPNATRLVLY